MAVRVPKSAPIQEVENLWIPLPDGGRLSAHLWLPPGASAAPVPAVVEVSPYRHEDHTRRRDAIRHPYFAEHGYASLRVDIRGSGASSGVLLDEYTEQEQDDLCAALAWIAEQSWCDGSLGMIGLSWGGFAALQAAARRPPWLKAIVTVCASADRYGADVKYHGGCVLGVELLPWSSTMLAMSVRPPDPDLVGEGWRDLWLERLEGAVPFAETWLSHQRRDSYWHTGSPCEDYAAIECPVYAVGGCSDPYRQPVLDLLGSLSCPRKGLIGPWSHRYPEEGLPGPAFDFRAECVRWWDHWLRGEETGVMDEPMLHAWLQEPTSEPALRPGRWVCEERWPPLRSATDDGWLLGEGTLGEERPPDRAQRIASPEHTGLDGGAWCPWTEDDLPTDQRGDDELSLTFTSQPLEHPVEILGQPSIELEVATTERCALLAVRLCDVAPDGSSALVTRGLLNLAHRTGSASPKPLKPGERVRVTVPLEAIAYAFPPGHCVRVSVSSTYWPWAWPSPRRVEVILFTGVRSRLRLPVRPAGRRDGSPPGLLPAPPQASVYGLSTRTARRDHASGRWTLEVERSRGRRVVAPGTLEIDGAQSDVFEIVDGDPLSAEVRCGRTMGMRRDGWSAHVETTTRMRSDSCDFVLEHEIHAYENGDCVFTRRGSKRIPRDLV